MQFLNIFWFQLLQVNSVLQTGDQIGSVLAIVLTIFIIFIIYLVFLTRKAAKLEEQIKNLK